MQDQLGAEGDFAKAYIIAHEYGHHVQNVLGISDQVRQAEQSDPAGRTSTPSAWSCRPTASPATGPTAGRTRGVFILSQADIQSALDAAAAVGDDRIQAGSGGGVNPESWTHGSGG